MECRIRAFSAANAIVAIALVMCVTSAAPCKARKAADRTVGAVSDPIAERSVRAAAAQVASAEAGDLSFRVTSTTLIRGGPMHRVQHETALYAESDGTLLTKHVTAYDEDARRADTRALAKMSAASDGSMSRFGLQLPYRSGAVDRYVYGTPVQTASGETIAFTALDRDAAHGDGTLVLDTAGRPERIEFVPAALPDRSATSARVTVTFGAVAGGRRDITAIVRHFTGRRLFIRGTVDVTSVYDDYRSYPSRSAMLLAVGGP